MITTKIPQFLVYFMGCCIMNMSHAATPCDFKGLSVGDKLTPVEIMKHFGIASFKTGAQAQTKEQRDTEFNALMDRSKKVGSFNALEEEEFKVGPICDESICRIPYGVTVGNEPYPLQVNVLVSFDKSRVVTEIDVSFDKASWDDVVQMLNVKYGDNWRRETNESPTINFESNKSTTTTVTSLTHRSNGRNLKTGSTCTIYAVSDDRVFVHSTPPFARSEMQIKLVSTNF